MTTTYDPQSGGLTTGTVIEDVKPPLLEVGPLAWVRKNLFSSLLDTLLTIGATAVIIGALSSFLIWAIGQADWFVIIFNLRLLMLGRYPIEAGWRVALLAALTAFAIGVGLAAWSRVSRTLVILIAIILAVMFISPPLITSLLPLPPAYFSAGTGEIASGSAKETPVPQVGFIAQAGETITVRLASQYTTDDNALATVYSFSDKAAALLANAAANRLTTQARIDELNAQLSSDLLTAGQRNRLEIQLGKLTVEPPITETFAVNQGAVNVRILDGATLEPLAEAALTNDSEPLSVTLPTSGWYVLEKIPADEQSAAAILEVRGIGPILERQLVNSASGEDADEAATTTTSAGGRSSQYVRMTDGFTTDAARPAVDGRNLPMALSIDLGYRGTHSLNDFVRLYVGQFFDVVKLPVLMLVVAGALGYVGARVADRRLSPKEKPRKTSRRVATWLIFALPVLMFGLVYGAGNVLPLTDTRRWGGLLLTIMLTVVGTVVAFPLGILLALGRRSKLPIISAASTLYIEFVRGVPLITVLFMAQLLVPLVNPSLAELPNVFRAMIAIVLFTAAYLAENIRGGLQSIPYGQEEAAKALGLNSFQITMNITLPQALRAVLPALVGMVISGFKDTSLVTIVGLLDLTGMAQNIVTQTEFIGLRRETLLFITVLYFVISYAIAAVSRRIEASGSGAARLRGL